MITVPISIDDPLNARILVESEDKIVGFQRDPVGAIARQSGLDRAVVTERLLAMLAAGTIRRIRQTLLATNLAHGALVAWRIDPAQLNTAFDFMFQQDPFSGHVVVRSTDSATTGHVYRLWTTLKVPEGYSLHKHCQLLERLANLTSNDATTSKGQPKFLILPAKRLFVLGVGHVRRKNLQPGSKAEVPAEVLTPQIVHLTDLDWQVLVALKGEFSVAELEPTVAVDAAGYSAEQGGFWAGRAAQAGVDLETFCTVAESLNARGVIGRFSTFLEHVKPLADGQRVTRFNGLFHWAVPPGREIEAGREIGRFHIMTHAYWREGGPEFGQVNLMGVAHGTDRDLLLAHKAALDEHLAAGGITVSYTNVFWGGRSEIKPSEISPLAYAQWCKGHGVDPEAMKDDGGV